MLGRQFIRENAELVRDAARKKNNDVPIDRILELDRGSTALVSDVQILREESNIVAK